MAGKIKKRIDADDVVWFSEAAKRGYNRGMWGGYLTGRELIECVEGAFTEYDEAAMREQRKTTALTKLLVDVIADNADAAEEVVGQYAHVAAKLAEKTEVIKVEAV